MKFLRLAFLFLAFNFYALAQKNAANGVITGSVVDQSTRQPVQYVTVTLEKSGGTEPLAKAVTDAKGAFTLEHVLPGEYKVLYSPIGADNQESALFNVDAQHASIDLGQLPLSDANTVHMEKVQVSSRAETFYNSIDRKVYNVGKDLQSTSGAASDLLQNIPSVQVDIEGNVSLRGSDSVLILINGKPSTLMGANRAAVLDQMPADSIERVEVITNPSAKYKPDGTAGIINIVLKKKAGRPNSGSVRVNVGNDRRINAGVNGNLNFGKANVYGGYSLRQDDRVRTLEDHRTVLDPATGHFVTTQQKTTEHARPLSQIAQAGVDYTIDADNKVGATLSYDHRGFTRRATEQTRITDDTGAATRDYDRLRYDPEFERDLEFGGSFQHSFAKEGEELTLELKHDRSAEQEDNTYTNVNRVPAGPQTYDHTLIRQDETGTDGTAEWVYPLEHDAKLETGYAGESHRYASNHEGSSFDSGLNTWVVDPTVTNRFVYDQTIHAVYGTYGRPLGAFGFLAGLRLEQTDVKANQLTAAIVDKMDYFHVYPTLHLTYNLTDTQQLQLNYSHRVRRPESDDLNPYPEYQDPLNLRAGNPRLRPEETHSVEAGYQYKKEDATYLATLYYRYTYHAFTTVTLPFVTPTGDLAQLTTEQNLGVSRAEGLELAATDDLGGKLALNASANFYRSEIDASNLGFAGTRSTIAWSAKLNATYRLPKSTLLQFNSIFNGRRLTPQGYRLPNFVANLGLRHDFPDHKTALAITISDLFDSLRERTRLDTPTQHEEVTRRRSSRIVYVGFIYNFGKSSKKPKDDTLQFDNTP